MPLPKKQINNIPNDRKAKAPYNFVPLPEKVVTLSKDDLPDHDRFHPDRHTGYFDVKLTTKSPLYVRCALTRELFDREQLGQDRNGENSSDYRNRVKNTPDFFYTKPSLEPVIPGSSLRGMLRTLLEIASFGKLERVTLKRLFYRTVDNSNLGKDYNKRVVESLPDSSDGTNPTAPVYRSVVRGGLIRKRQNGEWYIEEHIVTRIKNNDLVNKFGLSTPSDLYIGNPPNKLPKPIYQGKKIWADYDPTEQLYFFPKKVTNGRKNHDDFYLKFRRVNNIQTTPDPSKNEGILVLTGDVPRKKYSFAFFPMSTANEIDIPNNPSEEDINKRMLDLFHDDDQLTQWQCNAFPSTSSRIRAGHLVEGDPVFFIARPGKPNDLYFLGRAQMFRLPYENRPIDLVPHALRQPLDIDMADGLFGFIRSIEHFDRGNDIPKQGEKTRAYAGRVFINDAILSEDQDRSSVWLREEPLTPAILSSPKPTSFQHYLVQRSHVKDQLKHYDSGDTCIRGQKLYWHKGEISTDNISQNVPDNSTQHTRFRPVNQGVAFRFRIHFENLSDTELSALCWILKPFGDENKTYCHKLGMAKSLGLGSVTLEPTLYLTEREKRYTSLFDGAYWKTGLMSNQGEQLTNQSSLRNRVNPFETFMANKLSLRALHKHERIRCLLHMMEWPGVNSGTITPDGTDNPPKQFKQRCILPDPLSITVRSESRQHESAAAQPLTPHQVENRTRNWGGGTPEAELRKLAEEIFALPEGNARANCASVYLKLFRGGKKKKMREKYMDADWYNALVKIRDNHPGN